MRVRFWMKAFVIVPALSLVGLSAAAQQQGSSQQQTADPVADAARKAREMKKDAPKPKKVYTDDDLKKSAPAPDAAPSSAPGTANSTAAATTVQVAGNPTKADDPNGEKAWRDRFKEQREKIAKAEKELDILGRELEKAQLEYYPDPQKAMTQQNSRADINDKTAKIEVKKKELEQLKQELDNLEDQLRKSGGDPGWAR
jgi:DNA repair exonuclease SbcCD ATPase subunit